MSDNDFESGFKCHYHRRRRGQSRSVDATILRITTYNALACVLATLFGIFHVVQFARVYMEKPVWTTPPDDVLPGPEKPEDRMLRLLNVSSTTPESG